MVNKITCVICMMIMLTTGCAEFDAYVKKDPLSHGIVKVVIGNFEYRSMNYDPYSVPAFRDALRFEFFKKGINADLIRSQDDTSDSDNQCIAAAISRMSGDILIKGVISQREAGFLTDRVISSSISFLIYNKKGDIIGQGVYSDDESAGDDSFKHSAALKISSLVITKLNN